VEKHIEIRMDLCTGCRLCELACSAVKTGKFKPPRLQDQGQPRKHPRDPGSHPAGLLRLLLRKPGMRPLLQPQGDRLEGYGEQARQVEGLWGQADRRVLARVCEPL